MYPDLMQGLRGMAILRPGVCAKYDSGLYQIQVSEVLPKPHLTNFGTNKPKTEPGNGTGRHDQLLPMLL